jgi:hypothetical protein
VIRASTRQRVNKDKFDDEENLWKHKTRWKSIHIFKDAQSENYYFGMGATGSSWLAGR